MKKKLINEHNLQQQQQFQEPDNAKKLKTENDNNDLLVSTSALLSLDPTQAVEDHLLKSTPDVIVPQQLTEEDKLKASTNNMRIYANNDHKNTEENSLITNSMNNMMLNMMETTSGFDNELETSTNDLCNLSKERPTPSQSYSQNTQSEFSQTQTQSQTQRPNFQIHHPPQQGLILLSEKLIDNTVKTNNPNINNNNINTNNLNGNSSINTNNTNNSNINNNLNNGSNENVSNQNNPNVNNTNGISGNQMVHVAPVPYNQSNIPSQYTQIIQQSINQNLQRENLQQQNVPTLQINPSTMTVGSNFESLPPTVQRNLMSLHMQQQALQNPEALKMLYAQQSTNSQFMYNYFQNFHMQTKIKEESKKKEITQFHNSIKEKFEHYKEIEKKQEHFCKLKLNQNTQNYISLRNMEVQQQRDLEELLKTSKEIFNKYIIEPIELFSIEEMTKNIRIQIHQLFVFQSELDYISKKTTEQPKISMVVKNQPYPCVVKQKEKKKTKNKNDDGLTVVLLKGILTEVKSEEVSANVVYENFKQASANSIINGTANLVDGVAKFSNLRFPKGTGVKMVRLNFKAQIHVTIAAETQVITNTQVIESTPTEPFIVMTNESQFGDSAMKLLKKSAFFKEEKTTWPYFANQLQIHYLSATRQTPNDITRPLSQYDFDYIRTNFFKDKADIDGDSFKEFWKWFGKVLHKIRHQKPIPEMWSAGLIFAFVSKTQAASILSNYTVGHFLLRFSEKTPGQLALAYVTNSGVKHFLIPNTVKKLPDFLNEKESCKTFVVCKTEFPISNLTELAKNTVPKEQAIRTWCSTSRSTNVSGYEEYIN